MSLFSPIGSKRYTFLSLVTYLHLIIKVLNFISIGLQATKARDRVLEMTPKGNQETEIIKEDAQVLLSDISENV